MCVDNGSHAERRCTRDAAPLQTSPGSCETNSFTCASNLSGSTAMVSPMPYTHHRMENAKSRVPRCFTKASSILLAACVFISYLVTKYLLYSLATESNAGNDNNESHVSAIVDSVWSKNATYSDHNDFVNQFRLAIKSDSLSMSSGHPSSGFVPFILRNGKLLCRRIHRNKIRRTTRIRSVAEMIRIGLDLYKRENLSHNVRSELPFLLLNSDGNGCITKKRRDKFNFPRFTWSHPSPKHGEGWCHTIPVPSYLSWKTFHRDLKSHSSWNSTFAFQANEYPWPSKIDKAVWRGATTYDARLGGVELNETPRGKLVRMSMRNPELIDAAFVKFIQQYASREEALVNETIMTERMDFDDQMKYKAILDIDGNNWSSRFSKLLCTNSVVIKIDPDYIEYFYQDLKPMVHYVPASIENVTQVAAHVLDKENEEEIKGIVASANSWCARKMTGGGMAKDFMVQLEQYEMAFQVYMQGKGPATPVIPKDMVNKLVECN